MKKKLLLAAVILALGGLICFIYPVVKNRFFKGATKEIINNNSGQNSEEAENDENQNSDSENNGQKNTVAPKIEVAPKDCDSDCSKFKEDNEKEYCQEICGTKTFFEDAGDSGGSSDDCTSEKGIQKDYCLKDIAVGNKDFKTCDEIKDENIKKSCRNRLTEDLLESQQNSSNLEDR